jgi:hypothetical protein
MNRAAAFSVIGWLVRDTFRQARASGLFWLLLAVSALFTLVCLSVSVTEGTALRDPNEPVEFLPRGDPKAGTPEAKRDGIAVVQGELYLAFGALRGPFGRDVEDSVRFLQLLMAAAVADTAGVLLALVWTAGFLPRFLDPATAAVLLAKPVPRWTLILGRYLGALVFVAFQAIVFVAGTWLALGIRTDIWDLAYFHTVPLLLIHFGVFYSVACVIGAVLFWFLCWGMNYGRHVLVALPDASQFSAPLMLATELGYWFLPKPADLGIILFNQLRAEGFVAHVAEYQAVQAKGAFAPGLSVLASIGFAAATLLLAAHELNQKDY